MVYDLILKPDCEGLKLNPSLVYVLVHACNVQGTHTGNYSEYVHLCDDPPVSNIQLSYKFNSPQWLAKLLLLGARLPCRREGEGDIWTPGWLSGTCAFAVCLAYPPSLSSV